MEYNLVPYLSEQATALLPIFTLGGSFLGGLQYISNKQNERLDEKISLLDKRLDELKENAKTDSKETRDNFKDLIEKVSKLSGDFSADSAASQATMKSQAEILQGMQSENGKVMDRVARLEQRVAVVEALAGFRGKVEVAEVKVW